MKIRLIALVVIGLALSAQPAFADGKTSLTTSVHSKVLNGYKRTKGPDGKFKPEYYALSNGGAISGTMRDSAMEKVDFPQLSGVLGQFLAQQNYHLARDSKSAELLLLVNWGHTTPRLDENYSATMNNLSYAMIVDRAGALEAAEDQGLPANPYEGGPRGAGQRGIRRRFGRPQDVPPHARSSQ